MRNRVTADSVSRLLPALTPAAVLLTDEPDDAVELLAAALTAPRALEDPATARHALARQVLGGRRWSAEQIIETSAPATAPDDDASLATALRDLPDRQRAALILQLFAGGTAEPGDAEVATTRLLADLARRDEAERQRADPYRAPGSAAVPDQPAVPLPERLAGLAAGRPLPPGAAETIAGTVTEAHRSRSRRRLRFAAGAAVAALLVALVPLLPEGAETPQTDAATTVYDQPTRGTLAGNRDFLAAMAEGAWPGAPGETDSRWVVFADDVPGGRWALVAAGGSRARPAAIAWFTGPSGASPDRMIVSSFRTDPDPSLPVALTDPTTGALVVVGAPGDRVAVSGRPDVGADGSVTRSYRDVHTIRGAAVVGLTPVPDATVSAVRLHVTRDQEPVDILPPAVLAGSAASRAVVPVVALRPETPSVQGDSAVETRLRSVLGQLGEVATATPVTALWSGALPGPTRLSVLAVEQPSGAFVVTAPYTYTAEPGGRGVSSWCGTGVLPAGAPLDQRVVAVECDIRDLSIRAEINRFLVVVGPRTATAVQLLDDARTVLSEHPLDDGVAVVRSPGDVAAVSVTTAGGGSAESVPLADTDLAG